MRALLLSSHYPPDPAATGQLVADLAEDLASRGHQPVVVAARPSYVADVPGSRHGVVQTEHRDGVEIHWMRLPTHGRRRLWGRLLPFAAYGLGAAALLPTLGTFDLVYTLSTPPLLAGLLAALYARVRGVPFVYNLQDVYPDLAVALGVVRPGPVARVAEGVETRLRARADALVVLGGDMAEHVRRTSPAGARVEVIANWADTGLVQPVPAEENAFLDQHALRDRFVVLYSGNLGHAHGAELIPDLAARLAPVDDVVVLVIGEGPAKAQVEAEVVRRRLGNVRFLPYQDRARIRWSLSAADVSLVFQRPETKGLVVPSKLYGILSSGRPVMAAVPAGSEVATVVAENDVGVVVAPGDVPALAAAITELRADPRRRAAMGAAARALAEARYSRAACTGRYIDLFEELGTRAGARAPVVEASGA